MRQFQGDKRADWLRHDDAEGDGDREFEVAVECEEDQKNQKNRERADDHELPFRFKKLTVFAAPFQAVAGWQGSCDVGNGALAIFDGTLQVAAFNAELDADVAGIVFAVDEGGAVALLDVRERPDGDLLAGGGADKQIANLLRAFAEFGLHPYDEIEEFLALDDLRCGLTSYGGLNDALDVGNIDAVACDFVAIHLDKKAGLA